MYLPSSVGELWRSFSHSGRSAGFENAAPRVFSTLQRAVLTEATCRNQTMLRRNPR